MEWAMDYGLWTMGYGWSSKLIVVVALVPGVFQPGRPSPQLKTPNQSFANQSFWLVLVY